MSDFWPRPPQIVVLTGAGISRESGFAPFAANEMPPRLRLEDVVTAAGFARDPARVQEFYNLRRRQLLACRPNPAHEALAALDIVRNGEVAIVTGNIDDLHERAGARAVIHTQGELLKARCRVCGKTSDWRDDITADAACPICANAGHLRPHVLWVGEPMPNLDRVYRALAQCRQFLVVGTAVGNEPAQSFLAEARRARARVIEFSREASPDPDLFDECIPGPLAATVPEYIKQLIAAG
jgi:NAD-dependent deacetylase